MCPSRFNRVLKVIDMRCGLLSLTAIVDPRLGILMNKQWRRSRQVCVTCITDPLAPPGPPGSIRSRMRRCTDTQKIQNRLFAVAVPLRSEEPAFRFPAVREKRGMPVLHPDEVYLVINFSREANY